MPQHPGWRSTSIHSPALKISPAIYTYIPLVWLLKGGYRWKVIIPSWHATHGFIDLNNIPAPGQTHLLQSLQSRSPEEAFSYQALQANTKIQKLICYWQNKHWETRTLLFLQLQYPHKHILLCSCMGKWALQLLRSNKSERANCSLSGFILQLRQKKQ